MTNREREILRMIKNKPMISQKELAEKLGITRSSVAVHITNLTKKGFILGKGYIVNEEPYVLIIGGSNIDIQGAPINKLKKHDSNPGVVTTSLGGVGRNICENIARLGVKTGLISAVGDDVYGNKIIEQARLLNVNTEGIIKYNNKSTSTYLSVMDETGDMNVAIAHMDVIDEIGIEEIQAFENYVVNSKYCVIDTNLRKDVIEYLLLNYDCNFILDCVSTTKAIKVKEHIGKFHTIKPNKLEAEILSGIKIEDEKSLIKAGNFFIEKGVKNVFISLGSEGVYYTNGVDCGHLSTSDVNVINATGAGDAFIAGITYAYMKDYNIEESVKYGITASILALESEKTINEKICEEILKLRFENINFMKRR
ncbi:carbohydrate kinase [Oceanirhabdus sp. W0125-5]|uniref:carbohydrate kinase n=1 Tax=Oceanirhabdus sp. W0125-5 TaxID=2999116 RepID=UPI0022F3402F|nr:carbohydrate kinase [Oceanirhabdus sp. W0125-5]WBW95141.1 winged helix-turn-helix transcriptional regulator [Oceanirhabdus sp. W0125-5]